MAMAGGRGSRTGVSSSMQQRRHKLRVIVHMLTIAKTIEYIYVYIYIYPYYLWSFYMNIWIQNNVLIWNSINSTKKLRFEAWKLMTTVIHGIPCQHWGEGIKLIDAAPFVVMAAISTSWGLTERIKLLIIPLASRFQFIEVMSWISAVNAHDMLLIESPNVVIHRGTASP